MRNSPKIAFVGDAWLKKISEVFSKLYGPDSAVYLSETGDDAGDCDLIVRTWAQEQAQADLFCPRFNIDGLATIEMPGAGGNRTFLGADPLYDLIDTLPDMKLIVMAMQGGVDFNCLGRFEASFAALEAQEAGAVPISDFLRAEYQTQPILTGCKKPAPIVTIEMARRIAARLSLDPVAFDAVDHYLQGELATKASRRCMMPYDVQKLGLTYDADPFWFPTFGALFKDLASDFRKKQKAT
ncbi:MAG: hypothetical protein P8J02_06950 [Yoonia sp.]|nr:hypothetical protein [Yoonia sp.]